MPVGKLNGALGIKPICGPALKAHSLPADPVPDEIALIRVKIMIKIIPIDITSKLASKRWRIRVSGLDSEIHFR